LESIEIYQRATARRRPFGGSMRGD